MCIRDRIEGSRRGSRRGGAGMSVSAASGARSYGRRGSGYGGATDVPTGRTFGGRGADWEEHRERVVDSALRPTPPSPSGADQIGLVAGDDVRHNTFGEGVIQRIEGTGEKAVAVVHFAGVGEKQLLLNWAPLEKL